MQVNDITAPAGTVGYNKCDTNADTCILGANFIPLSMTHRIADVYPYDKAYKPIANVPIVTGATAWDDENTGQTYILVFNESLFYGTKLDHSLINPNQLRAFGVDLWDNPFDPQHFLEINPGGGLVIPLNFKGTKLRFKSRLPTKAELGSCPHIQMTSLREWNPTRIELGEILSTVLHEITPQARLVGETLTSYTPSCCAINRVFQYNDSVGDEFLIHSIDPSLIELWERLISAIDISPTRLDDVDDVPARCAFISHDCHTKINAKSLAERWGIGIKRAKQTLLATTQRGTQSAIMPLSRRYRADRRYNLKRLHAKFATDTLYAEVKSLHQNIAAQIYSHKVGFAACYPVTKLDNVEIGTTLQDFCNDFGIPAELKFDGAMVQVGSRTMFQQLICMHEIKYHVSEPRRPNQNPAEGSIREIKKRWYRLMIKKSVPRRLWDYGLVWICETGNLSVSSSRYAKGRTSIKFITGETPEISEYLDFSIYDWVTYKSNAGLGEEHIGRWLGVSHKVGDLMSYWILPISCKVISCVTVQQLPRLEQMKEDVKKKMQEFDEAVKKKLDVQNADKSISMQAQPKWNRLSLDDDDVDFIDEFNRVISDESIPNIDRPPSNGESSPQAASVEPTPELYDHYIGMEVGMPRGDDDQLLRARVKRRAVDNDGNPIGIMNNNPILDTRQYEIEYLDGTIEHVCANVIAESLLAQVDDEGHRQLLLSEIIDHRVLDDAVQVKDAYITSKNGVKKQVKTTRGWEICVEWKDGGTDWISLKDLKHAYPVQLAEYAIRNQLQKEPAFAWWVPYVIKKRQIIISKLKSKYWQRTHKFGIRIPKSVKEAYEIDKENNNNYWREAIDQEMKKIVDTLQKHDGDPSELVGYQELTCHMVFDVKISENFRRKARYVADGHKTEAPTSVTYSSVVSRDSVRLCLTIAALNNLEVLSADIENAYLTAPCREKYWTRGGPEFGSLEGEVFIVVKALYGLKSLGAAFQAHLAEQLDEVGFKSSIADPDVWMRPAVKPDGEEYYEYLLVYVDDILCISYDPMGPMKAIGQALRFKKDKIELPEMYLGSTLERKTLNGRKVWTMTSLQYIKTAIEIAEKGANSRGIKLSARATTPMNGDYYAELDGTVELDAEGITFYQELIGMLRWAIEIGRVDIYLEVSLLSTYQAAPRQGHLEQLLHIFAFLKKKPKLTLYFDPALPLLPQDAFNGDDAHVFRDQYRDAKEEIPGNMPPPRGRPMKITAFVDASHASNKVTRRSHTGFILFVNRLPIIWYSKRQNTVESSTFSSEFIAMKTCMEHIVALRYKMRMFGVEVDGTADVLCDNQSVVNTSSKLSSVLNKKHNAIAYHAVRWAVAAGVIRVGKVDTKLNLADAMTKQLAHNVRELLFGSWTY